MPNLQTRASERLFLAAGALVFSLVASPACAEGLRLEPVDQASNDPQFAAWRSKLLDAVRRRDTDFVVSMADDEILLSFGGDYGRQTFREMLSGEDPGQGDSYWVELETVLELGGVFMGDGAFCAPYLSCIDVPGCSECDPYETVYVIGSDVPARARPETSAPVVATLSWDVLPLDYGAESPEGWHPVKLPEGRTVFLSDRHSRMAIDYRARFERTGDGWRVTVFIAGD